MAVVGRSCWRWRLGPNVPGVGQWLLLGHLWRCRWSVDGSDVPLPVSELTTCPRLGEDCWSRGLQSACFWLVAGWRVIHAGASLVDGHRIAPPMALGNRDLDALPLALSGSRVDGLCCSQRQCGHCSGCGGCHCGSHGIQPSCRFCRQSARALWRSSRFRRLSSGAACPASHSPLVTSSSWCERSQITGRKCSTCRPSLSQPSAGDDGICWPVL